MVKTSKLEEAVKETLQETVLEFMLFSIFVSDLKWEIARKLANFADYTQLYAISKRKLSIVAEGSLTTPSRIHQIFCHLVNSSVPWTAKAGIRTHQQARHPTKKR